MEHMLKREPGAAKAKPKPKAPPRQRRPPAPAAPVEKVEAEEAKDEALREALRLQEE